MFSTTLFTLPQIAKKGLLLLVLFFIFIEWFGRQKEYALQLYSNSLINRIKKYLLFSIIIWMIVVWNSNQETEFIYFQF